MVDVEHQDQEQSVADSRVSDFLYRHQINIHRSRRHNKVNHHIILWEFDSSSGLSVDAGKNAHQETPSGNSNGRPY